MPRRVVRQRSSGRLWLVWRCVASRARGACARGNWRLAGQSERIEDLSHDDLGLVAGDTNDGLVDVFLWDSLSTCPPIESVCSGKTNSLGCLPAMSSSGEPHVGGPSDAFFLSTSEFMHGEIAIFLWSTGPAATPFSGGMLCLAPPIVRTPPQPTAGTGSAACSDGKLSFHFSRAYMSSRGLQAGVTLYAQAFGRDRGLPPPFRTGLSDAIRFTTAP